MSSPPCTIILKSTDSLELPIEKLLVLCKHLFRFGVKTLEKKKDQIVLKLAYSPKAETMKSKLGNLPVRYVRLGVETDEEIDILKTYMRKYEFDLPTVENSEGELTLPPPPLLQPIEEKPRKRKSVTTTPNNKIKILENRIVKPSTSSYVEVYDEDQDNFEAQKYTVQDLVL